VALVPLLRSLVGKGVAESFGLGWLTGFVASTGILYWVILAMHHYGGIPISISLIILVSLTLYLSLYVGAFAALLRLLQKKTQWSPIILAPPLWVSLEYLRSNLLTGFPWENLGYSQYAALPVIQIVDVTGVYGVSFLVVLVNSLVSVGIERVRQTGRTPRRVVFVLAVVLGLLCSYGFMRIHQENHRISAQIPIKIGIAQGNIDQSLKWKIAYQQKTLRTYQNLTEELAKRRPDLVIWPETAVPFFFPLDQTLSPIVQEIPSQAGFYLLFGSPFYWETENQIRYLNSAFLLSPEGTIEGRYDKIHLVPFGEYVPLRRFLPFIEPLVESVGDLVSGSETVGSVLFPLPSGRFGVLICYEIIFPDLNRRYIQRGADFLITITNDAWFGRTSAPFQHFSMATFRAVENRVFVARAANTGISGIIDSTGRVVLQTDIFSRRAVAGEIFLRGTETIYTRFGDVFAHACLVCSILPFAGAYLMRRSARSSFSEDPK
jgi:apolipoprotein N-acyltransferase